MFFFSFSRGTKCFLKPALLFALLSGAGSTQILYAQNKNVLLTTKDSPEILKARIEADNADEDFSIEKDFRVEKIPVSGGAEIITIFANLKGLRESADKPAEEVPLMSILRDTLGDEKADNDRLRYVWMLTYANPSFSQKLTAAIPFLYRRTTNKGDARKGAPPPVIDIQPTKKDVWDKAFWLVFRNLIIDDFSLPVRAATLQYKENSRNYRRASITRALAVLALYETVEGKKVLSDGELKDIQAGMMVSDKMLGSLVNRENMNRVYDTNKERTTATRGQNWELLRQYSEAQGLYFEPLMMPDGSATHALVWAALPDMAENGDRKFDSRFLNIKNPWNDARLLKWDGYSEVRWFDENNYQVAPDTPHAKPKTMVPLALYGLDYPKIPALLIDFRDQNNPKKREMSRRVLNDLTRNVLSISRFSNVPYFVGHYVYDFFTDRRGMDINQPSRLSSYSQLKLLLSLDASLDPEFRTEIADRLEKVSMNPLENDLDVETKLAQQQYKNLIDYAARPDGLPAQIDRQRREEMVRLKHTSQKRVVYSLMRVMSFGVYKHREKNTPELFAEMDLQRQLDYHERYLLETAEKTVKPEIDADMSALNRSLTFISENGNRAEGKTAKAVAKIFAATADENLRALCLESLYQIDNKTAKKELLAIYQNPETDSRQRESAARYLKLAAEEEQRISALDRKTITRIK
jgi:hypothetical protein